MNRGGAQAGVKDECEVRASGASRRSRADQVACLLENSVTMSSSFDGPVYKLPTVETTLESLAQQVAALQTTVTNLQLQLFATQDIQSIQYVIDHYTSLHSETYSNQSLHRE